VDDRLYRSPTDRVIAGVAGGIAAWTHVDPSLVRVAWVLAAILSLGLIVLVYFVMMIVVPLAPDGWMPQPPVRATPGGDAVPGWEQAPRPPGPGQAQGPGAAAGPTWNPAPAQPAWDGASAARGVRMAAGTLLVVLGVWLLLGRYLVIDWNLVWPLVVMAAGVLLVVAGLRRRSR
jgi:phage shock protein C